MKILKEAKFQTVKINLIQNGSTFGVRMYRKNNFTNEWELTQEHRLNSEKQAIRYFNNKKRNMARTLSRLANIMAGL